MSRFAALDLATLPAPSSLRPLDYDAILAARLAEQEARLAEAFAPSKVADIMAKLRRLASSPMRYLHEAAAARELYMENRINEAIRSVLLATARGADLDHIGATRGVTRKVLDDSDPQAVVREADDPFRARIQLVMEAWSPHGTEGSYVYWALDADDRVVDVAVYGPNHDVDPPVLSAHPKMVILSSEGDGTADAELIARVRENCMPDRRRPVGDLLEVTSARPVPYAIEAVLHVVAASDHAAIEAAARSAADGFMTSRVRIGRRVYRTSLASALQVAGVVDVELVSPSRDLMIGPFEAPLCTGVSLTVRPAPAGWRDV
jgi:phage-related baseplate assembly protein